MTFSAETHRHTKQKDSRGRKGRRRHQEVRSWYDMNPMVHGQQCVVVVVVAVLALVACCSWSVGGRVVESRKPATADAAVAVVSSSVVEILRVSGLHWSTATGDGVRIDSESSDYAAVVVPGQAILTFEERLKRRTAANTATHRRATGAATVRVGTCTLSDPANDDAFAVFEYVVDADVDSTTITTEAGGDDVDGLAWASLRSVPSSPSSPPVSLGRARLAVQQLHYGEGSAVHVTVTPNKKDGDDHEAYLDLLVGDRPSVSIRLVGVSETAAARSKTLEAGSSSLSRRWLWPLMLVAGAYGMLWVAARVMTARRSNTHGSPAAVNTATHKVKSQ